MMRLMSVVILICFGAAASFYYVGAPKARHFAANGNFNPAGEYQPLRAGFNLADVSSPEFLDRLPAGVLGLVWVGRCAGADDAFKAQVANYTRRPKLFGFFLMDGPDPTGKWRAACAPEALKAEADWIHAQAPGARAFIALMNMGDAAKPSFSKDYAPLRTHIDLYGVAPYPCRGAGACDFEMIGRYVRAAEAAEIPTKQIVPTYQSFGGGHWDGGDDGYRRPNVSELERMFAAWRSLVAAPEMEFAYSWGRQRDDDALENTPELQAVFLKHNR